MTIKQAFLTLWHGQALFIGQMLDTTIHQHYATQIVVSLDAQPFRLLSDDTWQTHQAIMIQPRHPHQLIGDGWHLIYLADPALVVSPYSQTKQAIRSLEQFALHTYFTDQNWQELSCQQTIARCQQMVQAISRHTRLTLDPRIQDAIDFIRQQPIKLVSASQIAQHLYLSESRFLHLFKAEMNIPLRRYMLWLRLLDGVERVIAGDSFTQAAHSVGFSDSAHMSRTFRRMFGLSLSELFKHSQFIQVNICHTL